MNYFKRLKSPQLLDRLSVSPTDDVDDRWIRGLQDGQIEAFEKIYMKYKDPIYNYYYFHASSIAEAEELLQDLFMRLIEKKDSFRFESKFSTWLWTLARNAMIDKWRSAQHQLDQLTLENTQEEEDLLSQLESPLPSAEMTLIEKAREENFRHCLDNLAPNQKEVVILRSQSELSYEEIAQALKVSISAVKSLLVRAKEKLLHCLKSGGHHE